MHLGAEKLKPERPKEFVWEMEGLGLSVLQRYMQFEGKFFQAEWNRAGKFKPCVSDWSQPTRQRHMAFCIWGRNLLSGQKVASPDAKPDAKMQKKGVKKWAF